MAAGRGWFDSSVGSTNAGDAGALLYGGLDEVPVLAKAGGSFPRPPVSWGGLQPCELTIHVFAGADNRFDLYEDDGDTQACLAGHGCVTPLIQRWQEQRLQFTVAPAQGISRLFLPNGPTTYIFNGIRRPDRVQLSIGGQERPVDFEYDEAAEALSIAGIA